MNLTENVPNQDYGWYNNDEVNKAIDAAYLIPTRRPRKRGVTSTR